MTINKFLTIRFCLLSIASALCLSACSQLDPTSDEKVGGGKGQNTELVYSADLDAVVDDSPIEPISPNEARGFYDASSNTETHEGLPFTLKNKEYAAGSEKHTHILPIVDFDRSKPDKEDDPHKGEERKHILKSVLALYDKTKNKTFLANAEWSVRFLKNKAKDKPDTTKLTLQKVAIQFEATATDEDKTLDPQHEWYMMAFLGGVEISGSTISVKLNRLPKRTNSLGDYYSDMSLNKVNAGHRVPMLVPFATSWRQILIDPVKMHISPKLAQNQTKRTDHLTFKPQAAFIELSVANYISQPMKIKGLSPKITMESNCLTTEGNYDFSSLKATDFNGLTLTTEPSTYWKPSGTKKTGVDNQWIKYNGVHFVSSFTLNDFPSQINGRTGNSPVMVDGRYILAAMPFNPKTPPLAAGQSIAALSKMEQTLFYCEPKMMKPSGDKPTTDPASYASDPKALTPSFGSRYLLGSTGDELKKGRAYSMSLRFIRPMLPIERLYVHKGTGTELGFETTRADALNMPSSHMNPSLKSKYRLPYRTEISNFLTVNYSTLKDWSDKPNGAKTWSWGDGFSLMASVGGKHNRTLLANKSGAMYDMLNYFNLRSDGGKETIYGIMYLGKTVAMHNYTNKEGGYNKPTLAGGYGETYMYKVAVRITFPNNKQMKLDTYYVGSNLDINNQFYHLVHPSFWATLSNKDIISRTLPFNTADKEPIFYWGEGIEQKYGNSEIDPPGNPNRIPILRNGASWEGDVNDKSGKAWTVYWLEERSW